MIKMYKRCLSLKKALLLMFCVGCTSFMYYLVMLPNDAREAAKFETPAEVRSRVERETRATKTSLLSPNEPHHAPPTVKEPDNVKHTPKEPDNAQPIPKVPDNVQSAPKQPDNAQPIPKVPDNVQPAPKEPDNVQSAPKQPDNAQPIPKVPDNVQSAPKQPDNAQPIPKVPDNIQSAPKQPDNAQPAPKYSDCKCGKPTPQEPVKPTSTEAAEHKRTAVIIMTRMRSGSTFVGEIFNQHPEAFYIFEPIWALENHRNKTYNSPKFQVEWLRSLADCRLDGVQDILNVYLTSKGLGVMATCRAVDGLCARYRNFTSQWPGRCPIPDDKMSQVVGNACLTKRFTAIKTIRLEDIDPLQQIAENAEINLKVIQLVRDPRGVIASRLSLVQKNVSVMTALHNQVDENEVRELCNWMTRNKPTNQGPNCWLQKHHALLRYEDIGRNPIGLMKKIYKFIDTPSHENVTKWLLTHTKTSKKIKERRDPFGTKKDPEKTMNEWRTKLNFKDVQKIQSICKEAMYMHGYKFVMSESEMSDSSLNFHGPNVSLLDIK